MTRRTSTRLLRVVSHLQLISIFSLAILRRFLKRLTRLILYALRIFTHSHPLVELIIKLGSVRVLSRLGSYTMEWLGRAKLAFTHSHTPLPLKRKDGTTTNLAEVCEEITPPCQLNPLLFNGHMQTFWTATKQHGPAVYYRRKVFHSDNKAVLGTFAVDFVDEPFEENDPELPPRTVYFSEEELAGLGSDDSKPMLVVLHGLSGGSHEIYLRHAIAPLIESGDWEICVVNSRGCAMSPITTGVLYNARATWDIRQTVKWIREKYPNRPLYGLGFSLGANILTNYCGEEGANCLFKAAVVCSNPFNLEVSSKALQRTVIGKEVYQRVMGTSMKELIKRHQNEIEKYTALDYNRLQSITYLYEFDREVQCVLWGYPTEDAYYRDASSTDAILAIRIPFLAIHATDDPIAVDEAVPYAEFKANPYTVIASTSLGGHLCWFEVGGGRWFSRPVCNFLNHMQFQIEGLSDDAPKAGNGNINPEVPNRGINFHPMRRKMEISLYDFTA